MNTFLAIDLGTSNCRSAVLDDQMNIVSVCSQEYPLINLSPAEVEQDALTWWDAVKATVKQAVFAAGDAGKSVRSISISSQGIAILPVDSNGEPLCNSLSWLDMRAQAEEDEIESRYGIDKIFLITGKRANACYSLSKVNWLKNNRLEVFEKAHKIMLPMDYIQFKLTGRAVTDHTMAGGTMYYDITEKKWSSEIISDYDIPHSKLPKIEWSGVVVGKILPNIALELGLSPDVIIANGCQDQKCMALGAGISDDSATASLGTASCITQLADKPIFDPKHRIPCFTYLSDGTWSFEGIINTAASSYQWFKTNFAPNHSYKELNDLAMNSFNNRRRAFFFPYLAGMTSPFWGDGMGSFANLSLASDIGQLALAVMDGVSCNIKANLDAMQEINKPVSSVGLFGGGATSPLWCQLTADILNLPVVTQRSYETAIIGAAMLAKHAYDGESMCAPAIVKTYEPNRENAKVYEEYYNGYIELLSKQFDYIK